MLKSDKTILISELKEKFQNSAFFYLADSSTLTVEQINKFRRLCFEKGIEVKVVKNTLAQKALESLDDTSNYEKLFSVLKGPTTLLISDTANLPAKVLKEFRGKKGEKPALKAAYIDSALFFGDNQLDTLASLKSKEELLGEIIGLLQSPAKNLIGALKSGSNTIAGLVKALEERAQ
jgi:large subunit ribosomal protein L10